MLVTFFSDATFHSGAHCQDIDSTSSSNAIVNKNTLENGGLVGQASFTSPIQKLLDNLTKQKLDANFNMFLIKGTPSSHTVIHKYANVSTVTYRKVGTVFQISISLHNPLEHGIYSYELFLSFADRNGHDISLYGECGASGVNATTLYRPKSVNDKTGTALREQNNVQDGYFHRCAGKECQVYGSLRYSGDRITNRGIAYSITHTRTERHADMYEFIVQYLSVNSSSPTTEIFRREITFLIEPDGNRNASLNAESYFSMPKNITLTV